MADAHHSKQTGNGAIHPATYVGSSDPASPDTSVTADNKLWIDTTAGSSFATGWLLKIRATSNTVWTTILDLAASLALKANLASPTFTGTPAAPTASPGTNSTQLATTAYADAAAGSPTIANDSITDAKLRNSAALTVIGRSANSTGDPADIAAGSDGDILRRASSVLGFGSVPVASVTGAATTAGKLDQFAATTSAELAGVLSDETGSGGGFVRATGPTLSNPVVGTQTAGDNSTKAASTAYADNAVAKQPEVFMFAISDETTALTTGTAKITFRMPFACSMTILPRANVNTVSSSGLPTFDIKKNATTIFSTKITIDASEFTSVTAATPAVLTSSPTTFADDDEITVNIDTAGTGTKGAKITLQVVRT